MNLSLFKSTHGVIAVLLVAAFSVWFLLGEGDAGHARSASFVLWTGWAALTFYAVLALYPLRKYAQRRGYSPEFRMEVPIERVERAHSRLSGIRTRIAAGELASAAGIRRAVKSALKAERVGGILRVRIEKGGADDPNFLVLPAWREPLGRVSGWMHVHIYYGLAAAVLVWLHGGGSLDSPMAVLLNGLSYFVILTGVVGIVLWVFGPSLLTARERDISLEKAFSLRRHYSRKVEAQREKVRGLVARSGGGNGFSRRLEEVGRAGSRLPVLAASLLDQLPDDLKEHRSDVQDLLVLIGQRRNVESEWASLNRLRRLMHIWRLLHVPAAILLVVIVLVHVYSVWRY